MSTDFSSQYPHLFKETIWQWGLPIKARFVLLDAAPAQNEISNVNIVPFTSEKCVILQLADGAWEIPGGTLEPGETYTDAILRELMEEAGAQLVSMRIIGAWDCLSLAGQPYRPHLPHPHFYRLVVSAEVKLIKPPMNPPGAEQVIHVEAVSLETILTRFNAQGRNDLAELYLLAASLRQR